MAIDSFGSNTGNSGSTTDCQIDLFIPTTNANGTTVEMTNTASSFPKHGLIKFDLSSLSGVTVTASRLRLYKVSEAPSFYTPDVTAHALRVAFNETQATWNNRVTGTAWATAGATNTTSDIFSTAAGSETAWGEALNAYHDIDIDPTVVQGWIDDSASNHGLLLRVTTSGGGTGGDYWRFASNTGTDGQRPILEVTHTSGGGGDVLMGQCCT